MKLLYSDTLWPSFIVINLSFKSSTIVLPIAVNNKVEMDGNRDKDYRHNNKAFVDIVLDNLVTLV